MSSTLAFIMNPMAGIDPAHDTSFAFMLAGQSRGFRIFHVDPHGLVYDVDRALLAGRFIEARDQQAGHYQVLSEGRVEASDCAAIFIRTDPPFDEAYLTATWILSLAEQQGVRVINSPRGLREANEHLYSLCFPELCPETVVSSSPAELYRFARRIGTAIAKPIDGHAGFGVFKLTAGDTNVKPLLEMLTADGRRPIMVQAFVPEGAESDRRLFILGGELRAVLRRVVPRGDHRANVHVGAQPELAAINDGDRAITAAMKDKLLSDGLYFVGADVVGDRLIEVNVTSPTLVRELVALGGPDLAAEVVASI